MDPRVGRVLMVAPPDHWAHASLDWLDELQPAGVILFRRHLPDDPGSTRAAIARLQAWASRHGDTLLIAADEEGGFVSQISHLVPTPPSARALARATDPDNVRDVFTRYGRRMRDLGLNLDFAPVCDVNNNPRNPVIGVRSFGSEPHLVSAYARAVHEGLAAAGVLSCLKHFPGHGDTDVDSHLARPVIPHDRSRLDAIELLPFRELSDAAPVVMAAHVECPQLDGSGSPATLSQPILHTLLREELGFQGVVASDALEMQGVAGHFDAGTSAVRSLQAGCDLLLRCDDIAHAQEAAQGIQSALESGELSAARLDEAVARVDRLRALAVAAGDRPQLAEPLPDASEEAQHYRQLCAAALDWSGEPRWATTAASARSATLHMVGWNQDVLARFAVQLEARGVRCKTTLLGPGTGADSAGAAPAAQASEGVEVGAISEAAAISADASVSKSVDDVPADAHVLILAERRPLSDQALAQVTQLLERSPRLLLANLLTPEVDEPIAARFDARLQSLDHSDLMLETVAERWLALTRPG